MADEMDLSSDNSIISHNNELKRSRDIAFGDPDNINAISEHIIKYVGSIDHVLHERLSFTAHIDVHVIKPSKQYDFTTLVTSGMSDKPMTTPQGFDQCRFAELVIHLPGYWQLEMKSLKDASWSWPITVLKALCLYPHDSETWLAGGHTIPLGDYMENLTGFGGVLLLTSMLLPGDFASMRYRDGSNTNFYCVIPLYIEEMNYKIEHGLGFGLSEGGLETKFKDPVTGISAQEVFIVTPGRRNVCRTT